MAMTSPLPRVVMVVAQYPPVVGGTERACQNLARALVRRGASVTVLTRRPPGTPARLVEEGVDVVRLSCPGPRAIAGSLFVGQALLWLGRHRATYDVIHAHQCLSPGTVGALASLVTGRPALVKMACSGVTGDVALMRSLPFLKLRCALLRRGLRAFLCLNDELSEEVRHLLGDVPVHDIPNGIDLDSHAPVAPAARILARNALGWTRPTLVFTGVMRRQKDLPTLLEAVALAPHWDLALVGDGPDRPRVDQTIDRLGLRGRVRDVGVVTDVRPYLEAGDVFVLPSLAEGVSNALLEAMSAGMPAVVSDNAGNRAVVRDRLDGVVFPAGNARALASALERLESAPAREALGLAARSRVEQTFSMDAVGTRILDLYERLVEPHK